MFGNLLNKAKKVVDETEQIDDRFYAEVMDELSQGFKDKATVGKAIAQSNGDEAKFNSIYMKLRAKSLQDDYIKSQIQNKIKQKELESNKSLIKQRYKEGYFEKLFKDEIKSHGYSPIRPGGIHEFEKNGKEYYGKISYTKMRYVLADDNNEYVDSFSFELK